MAISSAESRAASPTGPGRRGAPRGAPQGAHAGVLAASGLVAGEGLAGVAIAALFGGKLVAKPTAPLIGGWPASWSRRWSWWGPSCSWWSPRAMVATQAGRARRRDRARRAGCAERCTSMRSELDDVCRHRLPSSTRRSSPPGPPWGSDAPGCPPAVATPIFPSCSGIAHLAGNPAWLPVCSSHRTCVRPSPVWLPPSRSSFAGPLRRLRPARARAVTRKRSDRSRRRPPHRSMTARRRAAHDRAGRREAGRARDRRCRRRPQR